MSKGYWAPFYRVLLGPKSSLLSFRTRASFLTQKAVRYSDFSSSPTYMFLAISTDETRLWNSRYLDCGMHLYVSFNDEWLDSKSKQNINSLNLDKKRITIKFQELCNMFYQEQRSHRVGMKWGRVILLERICPASFSSNFWL